MSKSTVIAVDLPSLDSLLDWDSCSEEENKNPDNGDIRVSTSIPLKDDGVTTSSTTNTTTLTTTVVKNEENGNSNPKEDMSKYQISNYMQQVATGQFRHNFLSSPKQTAAIASSTNMSSSSNSNGSGSNSRTTAVYDHKSLEALKLRLLTVGPYDIIPQINLKVQRNWKAVAEEYAPFVLELHRIHVRMKDRITNKQSLQLCIKIFRELKSKMTWNPFDAQTKAAAQQDMEIIFGGCTGVELWQQWLRFLYNCASQSIVGFQTGQFESIPVKGLQPTEISTFLSISQSKALVNHIFISFEEKEKYWKEYGLDDTASGFTFNFVDIVKYNMAVLKASIHRQSNKAKRNHSHMVDADSNKSIAVECVNIRPFSSASGDGIRNNVSSISGFTYSDAGGTLGNGGLPSSSTASSFVVEALRRASKLSTSPSPTEQSKSSSQRKYCDENSAHGDDSTRALDDDGVCSVHSDGEDFEYNDMIIEDDLAYFAQSDSHLNALSDDLFVGHQEVDWITAFEDSWQQMAIDANASFIIDLHTLLKKIDSGEPLKNNELANVNDLVEVLKTSHELSLLPINIIPTTSSTNSSSTDGESYVYKKFSKEQIQANWLQFLTKVWLFLENIFRQRLLSNPRERAMVQRELSEIILEVIFLELNVSGKILLQKDDPTSTKDVQITMSTTDISTSLTKALKKIDLDTTTPKVGMKRQKRSTSPRPSSTNGSLKDTPRETPFSRDKADSDNKQLLHNFSRNESFESISQQQYPHQEFQQRMNGNMAPFTPFHHSPNFQQLHGSEANISPTISTLTTEEKYSRLSGLVDIVTKQLKSEWETVALNTAPFLFSIKRAIIKVDTGTLLRGELERLLSIIIPLACCSASTHLPRDTRFVSVLCWNEDSIRGCWYMFLLRLVHTVTVKVTEYLRSNSQIHLYTSFDVEMMVTQLTPVVLMDDLFSSGKLMIPVDIGERKMKRIILTHQDIMSALIIMHQTKSNPGWVGEGAEKNISKIALSMPFIVELTHYLRDIKTNGKATEDFMLLRLESVITCLKRCFEPLVVSSTNGTTASYTLLREWKEESVKTSWIRFLQTCWCDIFRNQSSSHPHQQHALAKNYSCTIGAIIMHLSQTIMHEVLLDFSLSATQSISTDWFMTLSDISNMFSTLINMDMIVSPSPFLSISVSPLTYNGISSGSPFTAYT